MMRETPGVAVARLIVLGALVGAPIGCSAPLGEPTHYTVAGMFTLLPLDATYHSKWIITPMCGLVPQDGKPVLALRLDNKTYLPLWIRVHVDGGDGDAAWDELVALEPDGGTLLKRLRVHVRAETDYPTTITIFADAQCARTLEQRSAKLRFTDNDLARYAKPAQ